MKKCLLVILILSFVLLWCKRNDLNEIDIAKITDLPALQEVITQVSEEMNEWILAMEQAQTLVEQLQQKYLDLIVDTADNDIENTFDGIQKTFDKQLIPIYWLPLWAKKLWMVQPTWMQLDTLSSKYITTNDSGYSSTTLVYNWDYTLALQQAEIIAKKANLSVSKNYQQAQALAKIGDVDYISGLDLGNVSEWIVYGNHELLDTNIDNLLSVSVDQKGTLTLEATEYR